MVGKASGPDIVPAELSHSEVWSGLLGQVFTVVQLVKSLLSGERL